jgi:alpha-D-ribose 1-methylphosphonate 5-triphosphate synthase subunit PhnH
MATPNGQLVFRAVLDAVARPGEIVPCDLSGSVPTALVPVLALADQSTPVTVLSDDPAWMTVVTETTGAPVGPLEHARLVSVLDPVSAADLRSLRVGTAEEPEDGAQVFIAVEDIVHREDLVLEGPGVPGERALSVPGLPAGFWPLRADLVRDFPAGVDIVFVAGDGRLAAVPRSTTVKEAH